jgi:uncharacterized membrane-anchored protein
MIKKYRIPLLVLVVLLQTAALVGMMAMKQRTLAYGTPILLETAPIDPRSLFRGDYVVLNYKISSLDYAKVEGPHDFERHDKIYVVLRKGDKFWEPVSIHHEMPEQEADSVVIRGEVQYSGVWIDGESREGINVRYGIEDYFVPEGEGMALQRPAAGEEVNILVAVDEKGDSAIKAVLVNGKVRYEEKLF